MKIVTWNINGIRTMSSVRDEIKALDADIICFQETKVTRDMLEDLIANVEGYNSYFSFSRKKTGYSGVATYCRDSCMPTRAEEGLTGTLTSSVDSVGCYGNQGYFEKGELESLDSEGRAVITQHMVKNSDGEERQLAIINVYVPRVDYEKEDRKEYKLHFLTLLQTRAEALLKEGCHVIVLGDMNISHRLIDHCNPDGEDFSLRRDRQWLNRFLWKDGRDNSLEVTDEQDLIQISTPETKSGLFVDSFRYFYPDETEAFTCWCTVTSARQNNYGTRLDYILGDETLVKSHIKSCVQMADIQGSDHCPVKAEFNLRLISSAKAPSLCSKYMPEFSGKQQKLSSFFVKAAKDKVTGTLQNQYSSQESVSSIDDNRAAYISQSSRDSERVQETTKKRPLEEMSRIPLGKKQKSSESKKSADSGKQAKLMNFFRKAPSVSKPESKVGTDSGHLNSDSQNGSLATQNKETEISELGVFVPNASKGGKSDLKSSTTSKSSSSAWKGLLGGLGKAPMCRGHKESCALRTVKKDGPNKFKQFYVCARAEGHSSNPEARCDHFEWLDKKSKK